jgi:hypothetical protein
VAPRLNWRSTRATSDLRGVNVDERRGVGTTRTVDMRGGVIGDEEFLRGVPTSEVR